MVTGYGMNNQGLILDRGRIFPSRSRIFLIATTSRLALGPILLVPWALSSGIKQSEHEADHSFPSIAELQNVWTFASMLICLHGVVLRHKDNFTFLDGIFFSQKQKHFPNYCRWNFLNKQRYLMVSLWLTAQFPGNTFKKVNNMHKSCTFYQQK